MTDSLVTTGVDALDRRIGGGLPAGSLTTVSAPPDSQSEVLLYEACAANPARYLTTLRPAAEVRDVLDRSFANHGVDPVGVTPAALADAPGDVLGSLDPGTVVVVDAVSDLAGVDGPTYREFLDALRRRVRAVDGAALLHYRAREPRTDHHALTLARADVTFELVVTALPLSVETRLVVGKLRGGTPPREPLKMRLGERASVDTSRDI